MREHEETVSTKEAAAALSVSAATVRTLVHEGGLRAERVGGAIRIYASSLDEYQAPTPELPVQTSELDRGRFIQNVLGVDVRDYPSILTPTQVAEILDVQVSTVRLMLKNNGLPTVRVGRSQRVLLTSLVRWLTDSVA